MTKARASRFLENLRVFEDGVSALVGCLLVPEAVASLSQAFSLRRDRGHYVLCKQICAPRRDGIGARNPPDRGHR
jgi:hypothetical protein